jgi:HAD superfamily hydrolase (TIGR01509 family)
MIKAIIFDMDGVLLDSQPLHYKIDIAVLARAGYEATLDTVKPFTGMSNPDRWPKYKEVLGLQPSTGQLIDWANEIMLEMFEKEPLTPINGIPQLINMLKAKNMPLAVASSSSHALIDLILEKIGLTGRFDVLVSGEDVKIGKPAPDVFLYAAKRLSTVPDACLVVEDSTNGILAAKRAGMVCVAYKNREGDADYVIDKYEDFPTDIIPDTEVQ